MLLITIIYLKPIQDENERDNIFSKPSRTVEQNYYLSSVRKKIIAAVKSKREKSLLRD